MGARDWKDVAHVQYWQGSCGIDGTDLSIKVYRGRNGRWSLEFLGQPYTSEPLQLESYDFARCDPQDRDHQRLRDFDREWVLERNCIVARVQNWNARGSLASFRQ